MQLYCALLAEGSSDKCLLPIIRWAIEQIADTEIMDFEFLENLQSESKRIEDKLKTAKQLMSEACNLLFIHRDGDNAGYAARSEEIAQAWQLANMPPVIRPIKIIPLRMTEAWLLINEQSIRRAAGKRQGKTSLNLPTYSQLEQLNDPKSVLFDALRAASEKTGRHAINLFTARQQVADYIEDFSPLRQLQAFRLFEEELRNAIGNLG